MRGAEHSLVALLASVALTVCTACVGTGSAPDADGTRASDLDARGDDGRRRDTTRDSAIAPDVRVHVPCTPPQASYRVSASDVVDLIQTRCDGSRCHVGGFAAGLDMRRAVFFENTVGIPSLNAPLLRIHPGQPARSFVYVKLTAPTSGNRMPSGGPFFGGAELTLVRRFIEDCAHEGAIAGQPVGP